MLCVACNSIELRADEPRLPIPNGDSAPELKIAAWSDNQSRSLASLKGKIVVVHFWGLWCGPCVKKIPVWKQLESEYASDKIIFVGIHSAGSTMLEVSKYLKEHDWQHVTAIDDGKDVHQSVTFARYGVTSVDRLVVIDSHGRVAFNGRQFTATGGIKAAADELGVARISAEADSAIDRNAILFHVYSKEIEAAIAKSASQ